MRVDICDDFAAVSPSSWDALVAVSPTNMLFQSRAWQEAWWRAHAREGRQLRLMALHDGDTLKALMPLFLERGVLKFIGDGDAPALDLLYDARHPGTLTALETPLREWEEWQVMELNAVPAASPTCRWLRDVADDAGLFSFDFGRGSLRGVPLQGHEAQAARSLQSGPLSRHAGVLATQGSVRAVHAEGPRPEDIPWQALFMQHIHRWMLRPEPGAFVARPDRDFTRQLCADPALQPGLVVTTLLLNEQPAGYHIGLVHGADLYSCVFSFDAALRRFSPDDVLWREVVLYALRRGCRQLICASSDEPVIRRTAAHLAATRSVRVFRQRHLKWQQQARLWAGRIPLVRDTRTFVEACRGVLEVLISKKKIVEAAQRSVAGVDDLSCSPLLARPEIEILRRLRPQLKGLCMLDMAAGRGRTGIYFAGAVKQYAAFDRAPADIEAAHACLDDQVPARDIFVADARHMSFAVDGAYDLILCGGGRIDEFTEDDRRRVLEEVRRVAKEGAWFCFSSRNLQSLKPGQGSGAVDLLRRLRRRLLVAAANGHLARLCHQPSAMLVDEDSGYRVPVYYSTPNAQVRALKELGFHDIRVFSTRTGLEVRDWRRWSKLTDASLYYVCRV